MIENFKKAFKNVPEEFWSEFAKEIKVDKLIELSMPIYDKFYTEDDIDKLIAFYNSPIGKKLIETTPQVVQESMAVGRAWGEEIAKKAIANLKEKGYYKEDN